MTLANLQWPIDDVFFAAQVMDSAGIWFQDDVRVQVVSGISALYMCLKLRANPQEADRGNPLRELAEHASQFLLQNVDEREVELTEVFRQEMQLLTSLNYFLPTSTVATWIEVFYTRTDVLTGGNATPLLRYAADVAKDLSRSLVHQTSMSQETPASAVAFGTPNVIRQRRQFLLFFLLSHFTVHVVTISIDSLSGVRDVTPFGAFLPRPKDTIWVEASLTLGLFMFSA